MTEQFLPALLGPDAAIAIEAAFGADLTDVDGSGWFWWGITDNVLHVPGTSVSLGRADNVSQAGAAAMTAMLNNSTGNFTAGNTAGFFSPNVVQNTPVRMRMTLNGTDFFTRFQGYLDSANPVTDQSAKFKTVALKAVGALGRLGGQKKPLRSALYRGMHPTSPVAYWPLEDGATATEGVSDMLGVSAARVAGVIGSVVFGAAGLAGTAAGVDHGQGGSLVMQAPTFATSTGWQVTETFQIGSPGTGATEFWPLYLTSSGGWAIALQVFPDAVGTLAGELTYHRTDGAGNTTSGLLAGLGYVFPAGSIHNVTVTAAASGGSVNVGLIVDGIALGTIDTFTATLGLPGQIYTGPTAAQMASTGGSVSTTLTGAYTVSHVGIYVGTTPPVSFYTLATGWAGESVHDRLVRLCTEQGIQLGLSGSSTIPMGPQTPDTILNLLRECEAADHGVLYDGLSAGIGYQCRDARYNLDPVLTLDMGTPREVETFAPIFDKQAVKNLYSVSRKGGGSATYEQTDGPVGTDTVGVEDASITINISTDDPLIQHASWLVGLGTVPGFRYPGVGLNLRAISSKAADVLAIAVGSHITIENPASKATDLPPDDIELIVEGWTETTTADTWTLALNTSPFSPYRVFVTDVDHLDDPAVHLAL